MTLNARQQHTIRRWASILALGLAGLVTFELLFPMSWGWLRHKALPSDLPLWAMALAFYGLLCLAFYALLTPLRISLRQCRAPFLHLHPPLWMALVVAGILINAKRHWFPITNAAHPAATPITFEVLLVIAALVWIGFIRPSASEEPVETSNDAPPRKPGTWKEVQTWAHTERPAEELAFDLLGLDSVAERLQQLLSDVSNAQAIAVVGPFGAGKSTLITRVVNRLHSARVPILTVRVTTWGFGDSSDAANHILECVVSELEHHVDVLTYRRLPRAYQRFLGYDKLRFLERLLDPSSGRSVQQQLYGLSRLLEAVNLRVLLIVEDADRGVGAGFEPAQLERLLWHFHQTPRFTYILAVDREKMQFDLTKLCEREEPVPELRLEEFAQLLSLLRQHCRKDFAYRLPPGATDKDRMGLEAALDPFGLALSDHFGDTALHAARTLIGTPRQLKSVVRRVDLAWSRLFGEAELDDLLILTILRVGAPNVFNFIRTNIGLARQEARDYNRAPARVKEAWGQMVDSLDEAATARPLVELLGIRQLSGTVSTSPQSVQSDAREYFERIVAEDIGSGTRDQEVLADLNSFLQEENEGMVAKMVAASTVSDQSYLTVWRTFAGGLPPDKLWLLSERLLLSAIAAEPPRVRDEAQMAAWATALKHGPDHVVTSARLIPVIEQALPRSVAMAADVFYFWASASDRHALLSAAGRHAVRDAIYRTAVSLFTDSGQLIDALQDSDGTDKYHWLAELFRPSNERGEPTSHHSALADWQPLGDSILEAGLTSPDVILPQLARVVGRVASRDLRSPSESYQINEADLRNLFQGRSEEALELMATGSEAEDWVTRAASLHAKSMLNQLHTQSTDVAPPRRTVD